ncbi:hypothetical protein CsSME_00025784 [Camellia sinensis var. sinensis]
MFKRCGWTFFHHIYHESRVNSRTKTNSEVKLLPAGKRLFQLINDLPTIFEDVTGNVRQPKDQSGPHSNSSKIKSSGKMQQQPRQPESQPKTVKTSPSPKLEDESGGDEE